MKEVINDFRKKANREYKIVKEVLDKRSIKFFATGGTSLGAVREGDFIEYDDDVDLGCIQPVSYEKKWRISEALRKKGLKACYEGVEEYGRTSVWGDVFIVIHWLVKEGDGYVFYWPDGKLAFKIPGKFITGFKEYKLGYSTVNVFDPAEPWLLAKYGDDWRTPIVGKHAPAII